MSEYCGYVCEVKELRKHPNADRLQLATFFGNTTIVDMTVKEGDVGIYFPVGLALSEKFCRTNRLLREKDANGNKCGGYLDPQRRNIVAIKLLGEKSDGLWLPLKSLEPFGNIKSLRIGDRIQIFNGTPICDKYVPVSTARQPKKQGGKKEKTKKVTIAPLFAEHADTLQLDYNLDAFEPGDVVECTLKAHGTSQRVAYVPIEKQKLTFKEKILKLFGVKLAPSWDYVCGTRRTVLEDFNGGYYGNNGFRKKSFDFFKGKLHKGEEVFFEIVGFTNNGTPIMPSASNQKLGKEFVKQYGKETVFSYGCDPKGELQNDFYVYRMTMTNEDGFVVEYSPDEVRRRCEEMGAKFVPVFWTEQIPSKFWLEANGFESAGAWVRHYAFEFCDGTDPIGRTHIREGVVARIVNRRTFTAFKLKNFSFKVLSGIAIAKAEMDGTMDKMSEDEKGEM